jgi:hypothetical protein
VKRLEPTPPPRVPDAILDLAAAGSMAAAIQRYRAETGADRDTARSAILDGLAARPPEPDRASP